MDGGTGGTGQAHGPAHGRDPGLQPERTALSWRRTVLSAVVADILIWRGWLHALMGSGSVDGAGPDGGLFTTGHSAQVIGLGICAMVACLATIVLVLCAVARIRLLHAGVGALGHSARITVPALMLRTASAAIVALAVAVMCALGLGF